ncbi:AlkA N-terminal domain-containing protein, partial [Enterococcus casseliflavus]|uniref:AlkA N-terminal domain-containing protein n=1 Tax=Enterococcus casseliflavus TaxID=37734 RepID=UPI003D10A1C9
AENYRMSPRRLRGESDDAVEAATGRPDAVTVTLAYRAPCDTDALLRFVSQRAIPGIEAVDGPTGARAVVAERVDLGGDVLLHQGLVDERPPVGGAPLPGGVRDRAARVPEEGV